LISLPVLYSQDFQDEEWGEKTGIMFRARITEDKVNVRDYPSTDGTRIRQQDKNSEIIVCGISKEKQRIDGYDGYWLESYTGGWVYSKFVNIKSFEPSPLNFESFNNKTLKVSYIFNGQKKVVEIRLGELSSGVYAFPFSAQIYEDAHYSNIPGTYTFNPKTKEVKHFTYLGRLYERSTESFFTDGFKYLVQSESYPFSEGRVTVWRMSDGKILLAADSNIKSGVTARGQVLTVTVSDKTWDDKEYTTFAENYIKKNPPKSQQVLYVTCEINLDTGKRTIKSAEYQFRQ